ncbi:MAG: metalloregulator ArsR/SmtB family transcription factor [Boseongicola sp.]|nr:metalloregulator ArsR/SmtB family transcription factor [Boseongicola sp.]MDD9978387.1 metalloregulator ArsR/SmtB family transcription factor [Boseongicola sp.]
MDAIFKALNDPARREILDSLRQNDGQTLSDLEKQFDMTRFGVMRHLGVLEDAGLITTRKVGRFKHHHLNAVPLQEVIDRWIEPLLAKPVVRGMIDLKSHLEGNRPMLDTAKKPDFVHQTMIRCTQDALWDALTKADQLAQYHFMCDVAEGDAIVGQPTKMIRADGSVMLTQVTTKLEPKTRIEMTFEPNWEGSTETSHIVFMIDPEGPHCKLTCEHYEIPEGQEGVAEGWARHVASLKSWLETGEPIKAGMPS